MIGSAARRLLEDIVRETLLHRSGVQNYLADRGLSKNVIEQFQLGHLPSTQTIFEGLKKNRWTADEAIELCLNLRILSEFEPGKFSSALRSRLIFPIWDAYGRIQGIAGRTLKDGVKPKYFNSAFQKGGHLYGLNFAIDAILENNFAIIVEGYMDVIAAHMVGIRNVVAVMGTAFTKHHELLLSRYTNKAFLLLDQDTAGQDSTETYMKITCDPLILKVEPRSLPQNVGDIDEFVKIDKNSAIDFLSEEIKTLN